MAARTAIGRMFRRPRVLAARTTAVATSVVLCVVVAIVAIVAVVVGAASRSAKCIGNVSAF